MRDVLHRATEDLTAPATSLAATAAGEAAASAVVGGPSPRSAPSAG